MKTTQSLSFHHLLLSAPSFCAITEKLSAQRSFLPHFSCLFSHSLASNSARSLLSAPHLSQNVVYPHINRHSHGRGSVQLRLCYAFALRLITFLLKDSF